MRAFGKQTAAQAALLGSSRGNAKPEDDDLFGLPQFFGPDDDAGSPGSRVAAAGFAPTSTYNESPWSGSYGSGSGDATGSGDVAHNGSGDAVVAVASAGDARINGILIGTRWSDGFITYSTPDAPGDYQAGYNSNQDGDAFSAQNEGFSQFSAQQTLALHFALNQAIYTQPAGAGGFSVEGFTNLGIDFAGAGSGAGTMRFANTSDAGTAYNFYPSASIYGGDGWFGPNTRTPTAGNYSWHTTMHEAGHGLGLKHGQEGGGPGNTALPAAWDSMEFTVMTYRSYVGDPLVGGYSNEQWGYAQTYMMLDIAALQYMYGADFGSNSGNTEYTWSPTTGQSFVNGTLAISPGGNRIFSTIWDGNGIDTYNLSNYSTNMTIDLRPGGHSVFSSVQLAYLGDNHYSRGNVFNALQFQGDARSLIENAIGGTGNDSIYGNNANNVLEGRNGNDYLEAFSGNDTLYGGNGNDIITRGGGSSLQDAYYGGADIDTISPGSGGSSFVDGVVFDLQAGFLILNGANYEVWNSFENYYNAAGTGAEDVLGTAGANVITTGSGANVLDGRGGNDTLIGGGGADTMRGGTGDDLYNTDGLDTLVELAGEGYDEVYSTGSVGLSNNFETLFLIGGAVNGNGNSQNNAIIGNNLGNTLQAGEGTFEFMNGLGGNDLLIGGAGHDEIMGGTGNDTFRFTSGLDAFNGGTNVGDFIYDFTPGQDTIQLNAAVFGIFAINPGVNFITGPNPAVTSAVPTLLYSTTSAYLLYDADGTGATAPYILAVLNGVPTLNAASFSFY